MRLLRALLVLLFITSIYYAEEEEEKKAEPEVKTEVQKALDAAKKRKEAMEEEKAKAISPEVLNEQISKVCKASKGKKYDEIQKIVSAWKIPRADQIFVKAYGQVLGRKLAAGYGKFVENNISDLSSSPMLAVFAKYSDEGFQLQKFKLKKDRWARAGLEMELLSTFTDGTVMEVHLSKGTEKTVTASVSYYFVAAEGGWRCAGNSGYYDFNADKYTDPIAKQEPKIESLARMMGAMSRACKRGDREEADRILATWAIPKSDVFFKNYFKDAGEKMDTNYETCLSKYVNNPQSEITTALAVMLAEASLVEKPDAKIIGGWLVKVAKAVGKEKSPLFQVKILDPNVPSSSAPIGLFYFLYVDGSFRLLGPRGFQEEGVLKPKAAPEPAPAPKAKKKK